MPTLEDITDIVDEEAAIIEWAKSPDAFGPDKLHTVDAALVDAAETQIDNDRLLAVISASKESAVSKLLPTVSEGTRASAQISGGSRMENSGNTYTFVTNYFSDSNKLVSSPTAIQSPVDQEEIPSAPTAIAALTSIPTSESSSTSLRSAPATSQHESNGMIAYPANLTMEREKGCYLESVTPSKGNIPFHPDTPSHVRAYMASSFRFRGWETLIPLWSPRDRDYPIAMSSVGMIGDVGYFDAYGGFHSLFNIFLTEEENMSCGYSPPTNFKEHFNFQDKTDIVDLVPLEPSQTLSEGWVDYAAHGKFQRVGNDGSSRLSFGSQALVTSSSHGSVIAYHNSLRGRINGRQQAARKEYIQHYLNGKAAQWYDYYNVVKGQRPPLKNGHLMLVDATWSTDSWASAVFEYEEAWESGTYFAHLFPHSSREPNVYAWKAHDRVSTKTSDPKKNRTPNSSDHYIAVGVSSIFKGDPPGHTRSKMKRGLRSLSQSLSSTSISSTISNSVSSIMTIGRRRKK